MNIKKMMIKSMRHQSGYQNAQILIPVKILMIIYNQVIRNQIKKDCELLKNRVRMLQQEMSRGRKKIEETKKKTYEIQVIKEENEKKYKEKLQI